MCRELAATAAFEILFAQLKRERSPGDRRQNQRDQQAEE
jgi:hypothetical protein